MMIEKPHPADDCEWSWDVADYLKYVGEQYAKAMEDAVFRILCEPEVRKSEPEHLETT